MKNKLKKIVRRVIVEQREYKDPALIHMIINIRSHYSGWEIRYINDIIRGRLLDAFIGYSELEFGVKDNIIKDFGFAKCLNCRMQRPKNGNVEHYNDELPF